MNEGGAAGRSVRAGGSDTHKHRMKVRWRCLHPLIHVCLHRLVWSICVFQSMNGEGTAVKLVFVGAHENLDCFLSLDMLNS